ncbi:hypothetical protein OH77DRAFT_719430 [Trametes cingulata]|nr:hypothetical protein OH77DRAFT_719430 [Trametes cingulata]
MQAHKKLLSRCEAEGAAARQRAQPAQPEDVEMGAEVRTRLSRCVKATSRSSLGEWSPKPGADPETQDVSMDASFEGPSQPGDDVEAQLRQCQRRCARLKQQLSTATSTARISKKAPASQPASSRSDTPQREGGRQATSLAGRPATSSRLSRAAPQVNMALAGTTALPQNRSTALAVLPGPSPGIRVNLTEWLDSPAIFTRQSLSAILGGGTGMFVSCWYLTEGAPGAPPTRRQSTESTTRGTPA